jgi:hypothetical protein
MEHPECPLRPNVHLGWDKRVRAHRRLNDFHVYRGKGQEDESEKRCLFRQRPEGVGLLNKLEEHEIRFAFVFLLLASVRMGIGQ